MHIVFFEDLAAARLSPITLSRPAHEIHCAGTSLADALTLEAGVAGTSDRPAGAGPRAQPNPTTGSAAIVRPHLGNVTRARRPTWQVLDGTSRAAPIRGDMLLVNSRVVPSPATLDLLRWLGERAEPGVLWAGSTLAAAWMPDAELGSDVTVATLPVRLAQLGIEGLPRLSESVELLDYPHDAIRYHMKHFGGNLARRVARCGLPEVARGVYADPSANLDERIVFDTTKGPVVIGANCQIGPMSYFRGPVLLEDNVRVIEHAAIKDDVHLGHTTKVGGEIESSTIEAYTNKQHYGFIGHSYLGSWINMGAGTCNSDLKNTYGEVRMEYSGEKVGTGMQFVGCIVGDYSKTAIQTGIFTGKVVGVCSMIYGFVTTNVPSFVNYARLFNQVTELPPEVVISGQKRMFERRGVQQTESDIKLVEAMYELTRHERQIAGEPLML